MSRDSGDTGTIPQDQTDVPVPSEDDNKDKQIDSNTQSSPPVKFLSYAQIVADSSLELQSCFQIVAELSHEYAFIFNQPVNSDDVPNYYEVVEEPMDRNNLLRFASSYYTDVNEVKADISKVWKAAYKFNPPENEVHQYAQESWKIFEQKIRPMEAIAKHNKTHFGGP